MSIPNRFRIFVAFAVGVVAIGAIVVTVDETEHASSEHHETQGADRSARPSRAMADVAEEPEPTDGCRHGLFPEEIGHWFQYRIEVLANTGELNLVTASARHEGAETIIEYSGTLVLPGSSPIELAYERRCNPQAGAEEPWFGYGMGAAIRFEDQTWRWPNALALGDTFAGTVSVHIVGQPTLVTRRTHEVIRREQVRFRDETLDAWVVRVVDRRVDGSTPELASTYRVVEGVGLFRTEQTIDAQGTVMRTGLVDLGTRTAD